MTSESLAIAQVSPFSLEADSDVGRYVQRVSSELARRGHRVLVVAPSESAALVRDSRRLLRGDPARLLDRASGEPVTLAVGEVLPFSPARRRAASLPLDVARTIETAFSALPLDVVHVHEPYAPSAASSALRHSRALNVGSFHSPAERVLSTQLAAPLSRLLFSRLDARIASLQATRELLARYFPAEYRVILPGTDPPAARDVAEKAEPFGQIDPAHGQRDEAGGAASGRPLRLAMVADEERAALRTFLRALRELPPDGWEATVLSPGPLSAPATLSRALRERVEFRDGTSDQAAQVLGGADVLVLASEGDRMRPAALLQAIAAGVVPVASRLPAYEELLGEGRHGLLFEPGDAQTLCAQLTRLMREPDLRARLSDGAAELRGRLGWGRVAEEVDAVYGELIARRHAARGSAAVRRRLSERALIDVDLHMHTDHSPDCATPVEVLLAEAVDRGLGAIAITDHNEISGALEARDKAPDGLQVIVGEEVKTADQGEVIGLFISELIPRGMTLPETIAEIKRQGGLVYVPHPFDRLHSVPDYEHLLSVLDDVDAIEVFNPRVAINEFNEEAVRFAAKYRIPAGAGSDAHVTQGLGSVRIRMRDFRGPDEFLQSLRDADIVRNPASLLYVQALKFLQTKAMPPAARRASRDRRVRRAARKS